MTPKQQSILEHVAAWADHYPCIKAVHVFGSIARGDEKPTSDIDIAFEYVASIRSNNAMVACYTQVNTDWDDFAAALKGKFGHQPKCTGLFLAGGPDDTAWAAIRAGREVGRIGQSRPHMD